MPTVTVNLYATFREHIGGQPSVTVPVAAGQTVEELLNQLGVPIDETRIIFCDNRLVELSHTLSGDETLGVFPQSAAGEML